MKVILHELSFDSETLGRDIENNAEPGGTKVPANIYEAENEYRIELLAPGFQDDEFSIEMDEQGLLIVKAESFSPPDEGDLLSEEFTRRNFSRSFLVPNDVLDDDLAVSYESGILVLRLPRAEL